MSFLWKTVNSFGGNRIIFQLPRYGITLQLKTSYSSHNKAKAELTLERNASPFSSVQIPAIPYQIPLQSRKHMPGAHGKSFPKYLNTVNANNDFLLALQTNEKCRLSVKEWSLAFREHVDKLLPKYEAVLFKNLPLATVEDFKQFFTWTGYEKLEYIGGKYSRINFGGAVYSASEEPKETNIELHNDFSYSAVYNKKVKLVESVRPSLCGEVTAQRIEITLTFNVIGF